MSDLLNQPGYPCVGGPLDGKNQPNMGLVFYTHEAKTGDLYLYDLTGHPHVPNALAYVARKVPVNAVNSYVSPEDAYVSPEDAANYRSEDQPPPTPDALAGDKVFVDEIEPVLSAEEWARVRNGDPLGESILSTAVNIACYAANYYDRSDDAKTLAGLIAAANDVLPDSDPRKITRAWVDHLKRVHWEWRQATRDQAERDARDAWAAQTWQIICALESYLPPE